MTKRAFSGHHDTEERRMITARRKPWSDEEPNPEKRLEALLEQGVSELPLPSRLLNALEDADIITVEELLRLTPDELLSIEDFRPASLKRVWVALAEVGVLSYEKADELEKAMKARDKARKEQESSEIITCHDALQRCISHMEIVIDNLLAKDPESLEARQLLWAVDAARSRRPDEITKEESQTPTEVTAAAV